MWSIVIAYAAEEEEVLVSPAEASAAWREQFSVACHFPLDAGNFVRRQSVATAATALDCTPGAVHKLAIRWLPIWVARAKSQAESILWVVDKPQ